MFRPAQGVGEMIVEQLGPVAVIDETDGAEIVVSRADEDAAGESGKRFGRPAVLLCIAVVGDVAGHDQVMCRIPLFDQLEQLHDAFVVFLAAMEVQIADVNEFHGALPSCANSAHAPRAELSDEIPLKPWDVVLRLCLVFTCTTL
jgi:hypothetical protein